MLSPTEQKIWDIAEGVAESADLRLVRVRLSGGDYPVLQIMLEPMDCTPTNRTSITVKECTAFSREMSAILDVEDPIASNYNLEVSSTGLERPLVTKEDFELYTPHRIKLQTRTSIGGQRKFSGILQGLDAENEEILLEVEKTEEMVRLPYSEVAKAELAYSKEELNQALGLADLKGE
ncbi:MAG: hypothetical protein CMF62_09250 [Magnetococcales bacterium]|jgi:ribosome maturation factor RimP|nr:hypothetical protein [Magnetococcales bacterium]|tara:strand:+ start:439278 stop:439811 length:534 start_codon:yes stop_codon:yes gene_type:complete